MREREVLKYILRKRPRKWENLFYKRSFFNFYFELKEINEVRKKKNTTAFIIHEFRKINFILTQSFHKVTQEKSS